MAAAALAYLLPLGACMPKPSSAIYDYIVKELAPTEYEPDEAPITIVCEPFGVPGGASTRGTITMRLKADTTPEAWCPTFTGAARPLHRPSHFQPRRNTR